MSTGSQETSSINQCSKQFISSKCSLVIIEFLINLCLLTILTWLIFIKIRDQGIIRIPKTKTVILLVLWIALFCQFIFIICGIHFFYYLYVLLDSQYFVLIVYYFIKKLLKSKNLYHRINVCRIIIGTIMLFFLAEFIVSVSIDHHQSRTLCGEIQYTAARIISIIIQLILTIIGWFLYKTLIKKMQQTQQMTLNDKNRQRIKSTKQDINSLLILITIFMISQIVLLVRVFYFLTHPQNLCLYIPSNPAANGFVYFLVKFLGSYIPKLYTMRIFGWKRSSGTSQINEQEMITRTRQQTKILGRDTMLIRGSIFTDES